MSHLVRLECPFLGGRAAGRLAIVRLSPASTIFKALSSPDTELAEESVGVKLTVFFSTSIDIAD